MGPSDLYLGISNFLYFYLKVKNKEYAVVSLDFDLSSMLHLIQPEMPG